MKSKIRIKKYGNRRLYNMEQKCYITLEDLTDLIKAGHEVQVLDSKTGEDLTQVVLTQLILESQKNNHNCFFTTEVLHQMIQYRDQSVSEFFQEYLPNILHSYLQWQQEAQSHFMHWAKLGWSASQYSRDFMMPGFNLWNKSSRSQAYTEAPEPETDSNGTTAEIANLKKKIEELENRLNKPRKQG
jgi:polyhydroxyalkanoate synthesis repressor PhaR